MNWLNKSLIGSTNLFAVGDTIYYSLKGHVSKLSYEYVQSDLFMIPVEILFLQAINQRPVIIYFGKVEKWKTTRPRSPKP